MEQLQTATSSKLIPPNTFDLLPNPNNGSCFKSSAYAKTSAGILVLQDACELLQVRPWSLAKLMGMTAWPHQIYSYLDGSRRPSQAYCLRLVMLLEMQIMGQDFRLISAVDWTSWQLVGKRRVTGSSGRSAVMSEFYRQRPR